MTSTNHPAGSTLAVRDVVKLFGGVAALNGVSIDFPAGSVTAVMGDNGAGKSTLMKILSGVYPPDRGHIEMNGVRLAFKSPSDARNAGIETVHQDLTLFDHRDVSANLFIGRELYYRFGPLRLLRVAAMRQEAEKALHDLSVDIPSIRTEVGSLSGGQRQAISIARSVHFGCSLLILDEPMAALGLREAQNVQNLIRDLASRGITQIVVSHNLDHTFAIADRVAVFRHGKLMDVQAVEDTSREEILKLVNGLPTAA